MPTLIDAKVKVDELTLSYDEVLGSSPKPATGDFAVTVNSEARSVTTVVVNGSEVTLTLVSTVAPHQTVRLTHTPGTNPIRDQAQNPAAALANRTVTNLIGGICSRTPQVRDAILAAAPVSTCGAVTAAHLSAITNLSLDSENISTLQADDFSGLTALETLDAGIRAAPRTHDIGRHS